LIRLWDARVLQENGDETGDESEGEVDRKSKGAARLTASKSDTVAHDSDDQWDDVDDDDDDNNDDDELDGVKNCSNDSDDSSDEDDEKETTNDRRAKRMKTENEKFFEDL
jgi:ribonuclease E